MPVLSIDGMLYPFQWGDLLSALAIFTLLTLIFVISFIESGMRRADQTADDGITDTTAGPDRS